MLRWFRSLFAWHTVKDTGVHLYQENTITGRRRAIRYGIGGYQPVDSGWVDTGEWANDGPLPESIDMGGGSVGVPPTPLPTTGSAAKRPGGVDRRCLLGMLSAAPIAMPVLAKASITPESAVDPISAEWAEYGQACAAWFEQNRDFLVSSGLPPQPGSAEVAAPSETVGDLPAPATGAVVRPLPSANARPFLDDVGGGP